MLATSPVVAQALIGPERAALTSNWVEIAIPVVVSCLDLTLDGLPQPRVSFALGIDRPLYYSVHSAAARLAPAGKVVVHAAKYQNPSELADPKADERELEGLLDLVQPGWRAASIYRRFLPRLVVSSALATADVGRRGRPGPAVRGIANLYVVGDWVGPDGLLADAALASARQCSEMIVTSDTISNESGRLYWRARGGAVKVS